jgi:cytochrome P450
MSMTEDRLDSTPTDGSAGDLSSQDFWAKPFMEREETFKWFREHVPVSWHRPYESSIIPPDDDTPGYWAVTRYDDISQVSRNSDLFCSGQGIVMEDFPEVVQVGAHSFLAMDDPEHNRLRQIVSKSFTPRRVKQMDDLIQGTVTEIVDEMVADGRSEGDFCALVAKQVPGRVFGHFMGLSKGAPELEVVMDAAEAMLAWDDPECAKGRDALTTHAEEADKIQEVALQMADEVRGHPSETFISWVVEAEFEGQRMEDWEIASFFSLLGSAANDTTRHTLAHAIRFFDAHPDQLELLKEDWEGRIDGAVEEVLRFASTVMHFRRTATQDTQLGDAQIRQGDKLVMWYASGNYDGEHFDEPRTFDITRKNAKTHYAFGAGGTHFCIGAALGRAMLKTGLTEVYSRMPDIHLNGEPVLQQNNFMHGVHALPVAWTPAG